MIALAATASIAGATMSVAADARTLSPLHHQPGLSRERRRSHYCHRGNGTVARSSAPAPAALIGGAVSTDRTDPGCAVGGGGVRHIGRHTVHCHT